MAGNQKFDTPEEALAHYGKKGMKWGVRNDRAESGSSSGAQNPKTSGAASPAEVDAAERSRINAKKVALGIGLLAAVGGGAYLATQMQQNGSLNRSSSSASTQEKGKSVAEKVLSEPTSVIQGSRGKNLGYRFLSDGGVDPVLEYERAGFNGQSRMPFTRYGERNEKIAVTIDDPGGRRDRAGRPITHEIIIPENMSSGINNEADVAEKIWPILKPAYDGFYKESEKERY